MFWIVQEPLVTILWFLFWSKFIIIHCNTITVWFIEGKVCLQKSNVIRMTVIWCRWEVRLNSAALLFKVSTIQVKSILRKWRIFSCFFYLKVAKLWTLDSHWWIATLDKKFLLPSHSKTINVKSCKTLIVHQTVFIALYQ